MVYKSKYTRFASVISIEFDYVRRAERIPFFGKSRGRTVTEGVYTLFYVAYEKQIILSRKVDYTFLKRIDVLVFVNKNVRERVAYFFTDGRRKNFFRLAFKVGKVKFAVLDFRLFV